jgi:2-polyprenyl-3-methyl-5-hydroxy-6-metoxy-1,4-benzoquinol methylase
MDGYIKKNKSDGLQPYNKKGDAKGETNKTEKFIKHTLPLILPRIKNYALDVGCGNGRLSQALSGKFDRVIALDEVNVVEKRFLDSGVEVCIAPFKNYKKQTFDLILFWGVFYLMDDYKEALSHAKSLLNPNGLIAIGDDKKRDSDKDKMGHYDLPKLVKECGLEVKDEFLHYDHYKVTVLHA